MNDFDRTIGDALKRVRDEHATSNFDLRRELLRRGRRRRTLQITGAAAGAVAFLVLAATTIPFLRDEAAPGPVGPRQPTVTATIDISSPAAIVANDENVWVASQEGLMSRIDTETNDVVEGPPLLSENGVNDMAFGPNGIWAVGWEGDIGPGGTAQSDLQVVDPESMEAVEGPAFPNKDTALYRVTVSDDGIVWAVNAAGNQVLKIKPKGTAVKEVPAGDQAPKIERGDTVVKEIGTGDFPVDVVTAAGGAWVSNSKSGTITEIDASAPLSDVAARTGDVVGEFPVECPGDLVVAFGSLWVTNFCENQIRRIDLSGPRVEANIPTGKGPTALVEAGGFIWVVNTLDETVVRVDPATDRVIGDRIEVGTAPESIASGGGAVWVANQDSVSRIDYDPQSDPPFTPLPTPTPTATPTPAPQEGFAIWPETTPAQAEIVCGNNPPGWRGSDIAVALRFAREVLGWSDATYPSTLNGFSTPSSVRIHRSEEEPDVRVGVSVARTLFGPDCLSVIGVSRPDAGRPTGLGTRLDDVLVEVGTRPNGAVVELGWDPRGAASAEVLVGFGSLEQLQEATVPHCRFIFAGPPRDPGYFLVMLKDDNGDVISAMGRPLPAGDFNAGAESTTP